MVDAIERAVAIPAPKIIVHGAARRQILRQSRPLAPRAQDIHQPVDDLPLIDCPLVAAPLGGRNQWPDQGPLFIRHVTWVAQLAAVIPTTISVPPHPAAPANRTADMESQVIPTIQGVPGWTLRLGCGPPTGPSALGLSAREV